MVFIIVGVVIAALLIVAVLARSRESNSPLKTVESFKVGLEKISPQGEPPVTEGPRGLRGSAGPGVADTSTSAGPEREDAGEREHPAETT